MQHKAEPPASLAWDDVRLFLALCRASTLSHAARALGVNASTMSRRLTILEEGVGAILFVRGRDGIAKTKAAEDLLAAAEQVEAGVARFTDQVDRLEREVEGVVRLTCPPDVADVLVAPMLPALLSKHRKLRIHIEPSESVLDLSRREADLALRVVRPSSGDLVMTSLATARWLVAASPKLVRELGTVKAWRDVPWIGWGARHSGVPAARWLAEHANKTEPLVRSDSLSTQVALARAGLGAMLIPELSAKHYRLLPVRCSRKLRASVEACPAETLFLVTHRALREVPRIRVVWDALVRSLERS